MLVGFGSAFAFLLALKTITTWFPPQKITLMSSYTMSVGCLGPVVGGPLVAHIVKSNAWTDVMMIFGIAGVLFAAFVWLIMIDKPQEHAEHEKFTLWQALKIILSSKQAWILALYTMMLYAPLSALGDLWGVAFIKNAYGVDSTVAAFANNMIYVGMVIGAPFFAYLALRMDSYKKPMIIGAFMATIALGIVIGCTGIPIEAVFVLFFVTGFSCGAMLGYPLAMAIFPKAIGATVSGFINMMSMVSGVILMPLIGWIINLCWDGTLENGVKIYKDADYRWGLSAVIVFLVLGILLALIMKDHSPKTAHK
jgi:MFS family permease